MRSHAAGGRDQHDRSQLELRPNSRQRKAVLGTTPYHRDFFRLSWWRLSSCCLCVLNRQRRPLLPQLES